MKRSTNFRYPYVWMDFQYDGAFKKERIKGEDKRNLGKWSRKKQGDWLENSFKDEMEK